MLAIQEERLSAISAVAMRAASFREIVIATSHPSQFILSVRSL
jgi:hypothetical protein